ncbi:MAG: cadherin domain-containing protein, partial [Actinomycetota bacterium]|nr:cadherin domain-containing protein [Actinomycetota bacterium]
MVGLVAGSAVAVALPLVSVERVSVDSDGVESDGASLESDISADGRYVAFASDATKLVPGDTNGLRDIFVHDRQTGVTERVSVHTGTAQGDGGSSDPAISADGRYVAFWSDATNLVDGDSNTFSDVFVHDRQTGSTTRVSVHSDGITQGDGTSFSPDISADGRYVAFHSHGTNLVDTDANGLINDIFVHDLVTGTTELVSRHTDGTQADLGSQVPSLSSDGRYVVFNSFATNLVAGDINGLRDVFVRDRVDGVTTRVSVHSNGTAGDGESFSPGEGAISDDGRYVAFESQATNLVAGDTNNAQDVFIHDLQTGTTIRISVHTNGNEGDGLSRDTDLSGGGRYVTFASFANNLVDNDTRFGNRDIFVHDLATSITTLVNTSLAGEQGNLGEQKPAISADGHSISYSSLSSNLIPGDTNSANDVFVWFGNTDPELSGDVFNVGEDATVGTMAGLVAGSDPDGDALEYTISAGNTGGAFAIDAISGEITVATGLDHEMTPSYSLTVEASDGWSTGSAAVTINVTDTFEVPSTATFLDVPTNHLFYADVEWMAWSAVTRGCNPPDNNLYCPDDVVTRGQMAAFLVRALGLTDDGGGNKFVDDDGNIFEADITKLSAASITKGCNPPVNDQFCPEDPVTRGQMAAFLVRALGLNDAGDGDLFLDDDGNIFESDIDKLGTAGVTKGCNPPVNDQF